MTYTEWKQEILRLVRERPGESHLAHIVMTDESVTPPRVRIGRTFRVDTADIARNDPILCIPASCLEKNCEQNVFLDQCLDEEGIPNGWRVEDCYFLERLQDAAAIPRLERTPQPGNQIAYFFGNTTVRALETETDDGIRLWPVAGDQTACGEWDDIPVDRLYGYCALLERELTSRRLKKKEETDHA